MIHHLATAFVDFLFAFFALTSDKARTARPMALVAACMGFWSLELFILGSITDPEKLSQLFHLTRWGMFLIPPSLALLTWSVIGNQSSRFFYGVVVPLFLGAAALSLLNYFVFPSELKPVIEGYQPVPDTIYYLFALLFVVALTSCIAIGMASYKKAAYREKQRIRWLVVVLVSTLMLGVISMFLIHYPFYLKLVGATLNMTFIGLLFYATVQHHLMEIRLALSVGLVKASAIGGILWCYFYIGSFLERPLDTVSTIVVMAVFVFLILELYPKYHHWALLKTKKILTGSRFDESILKQNTRLMLEASFDRLTFKHVLDYLFAESIRLEKFACMSVNAKSKRLHGEPYAPNIHLIDGGEDFDGEIIDVCREDNNLMLVDECSGAIKDCLEHNGYMGFFGILHDGELIAIMLLGKRNDGQGYSYEDAMMFEWLKDEFGPTMDRLEKLDSIHKDLDNANKTLSILDLMSHYHHEIKAPISIIDGVVSNDVYDQEKQREVILAQVARISQLIATMANIFQGQRSRKVEEVAIIELLKNCIMIFEGKISKATFETEQLPSVLGDKEDLTIMFINIIKNAIEAAKKEEEVNIVIKAWMEMDRPCISIQDNGVGMTQERVRNLFKLKQSTKLQGSGIGMQAIKRIANEHFADIEVNSEANRGTKFTIRFSSIGICQEAAVN